MTGFRVKKEVMRSAVLFHALLALSGLAHGAQADVFTNKNIGFEITRPATWYYVSAPEYLDNAGSTKLNDAGLQDWIVRHATAPLVSFAKSPEPALGVTAVFKVHVKPSGPLEDQPATKLVAAVLGLAQKAFRDYELEQPPIEVEISGIKSAYARINYSAQLVDGRSYPATSETWVIPRGKYIFILGAVSARDAKNDSREEISAIVRSVRIHH
jgi:hypothetical protein